MQRPDKGNGSYRITKREMWFMVQGAGDGKKSFAEHGYPLWFNRICQLYENYEMHRIRVAWESTYASIAEGHIIGSYNSTPGDSVSLSSEYLLAQRNAKQAPVRQGRGFIDIPPAAFKQTPSRRPCRGEKSWLFEFLYSIRTSSSGTITFFLEYDVTFRVPQLMPAETQKKKSSFSATAAQNEEHTRHVFTPNENEQDGIRFNQEGGFFEFSNDAIRRIIINAVLQKPMQDVAARLTLSQLFGTEKARAITSDEGLIFDVRFGQDIEYCNLILSAAGDQPATCLYESNMVQEEHIYDGETAVIPGGTGDVLTQVQTDDVVGVIFDGKLPAGDYRLHLPGIASLQWCTVTIAVTEENDETD